MNCHGFLSSPARSTQHAESCDQSSLADCTNRREPFSATLNQRDPTHHDFSDSLHSHQCDTKPLAFHFDGFGPRGLPGSRRGPILFAKSNLHLQPYKRG